MRVEDLFWGPLVLTLQNAEEVLGVSPPAPLPVVRTEYAPVPGTTTTPGRDHERSHHVSKAQEHPTGAASKLEGI